MCLVLAASNATGQVYRWVDAKGTVHYSNEAPPPGVHAAKVDTNAEPRAPVTESVECYTQQCQTERLEQRLARREQVAARVVAERGSPTAHARRGLDARTFAAIRPGMSEGEVLEIAGEPDLLLWDSRTVRTYTYFPTATDPYTITVTVLNGRVTEKDRLRR
jgi:hypothetical protein